MTNLNIQNYDFGNNWDEVLKYLTFPKTQEWIKKSFYDYRPINIRYNVNKSPADLMTKSDAYAMLMDKILDYIKDNILSEQDIEITKCRKNCDDEDCGKCMRKIFKLEFQE